MKPKTRLILTKVKWNFLPRFSVWVSSEGDIKTWNGKLLPYRTSYMEDSFLRVEVHDKISGKTKGVPIHYLVALAFTKRNANEKLKVSFKDGNAKNIILSNLKIEKVL